MFFRHRKPRACLAEDIAYYWYLSDAPGHGRERIFPSGTLEIVINLHGDEIRVHDASDPRRFSCHSGAVVSGAYRGHFIIDTRAHASIIGVHFRPGGAFPFLGVPPGELTDRHVDLEALWGPYAADLRERLRAARGLDERFAILDDEFARRLASAPGRRDEVKLALRQLAGTNVSVRCVAEQAGLSHRRLIELFTAEIGINPKAFSRVRRFQRTLALARASAAPEWAQLAQACGYFDQPHLVREFVALTGLPPVELLRRSVGVKQHHAAMAANSR